jgi:hypothetical protein
VKTFPRWGQELWAVGRGLGGYLGTLKNLSVIQNRLEDLVTDPSSPPHGCCHSHMLTSFLCTFSWNFKAIAEGGLLEGNLWTWYGSILFHVPWNEWENWALRFGRDFGIKGTLCWAWINLQGC